MYRSPDETPRCPCCQSIELGPLTKFDPSEGYARVHFRVKGATAGLLGSPANAAYTVDRARVCLRCGHVMHFLSAEQCADLRRRIESLEALLA